MIWPCQHNPELLILALTDSCPVFQHTCHNTVNDWLCWAVSTDACRVTVLPFHESCCWSLASTWRTTCGRTTALMQRMLTCCRLLSWWMRSSVRECQRGRSVTVWGLHCRHGWCVPIWGISASIWFPVLLLRIRVGVDIVMPRLWKKGAVSRNKK